MLRLMVVSSLLWVGAASVALAQDAAGTGGTATGDPAGTTDTPGAQGGIAAGTGEGDTTPAGTGDPSLTDQQAAMEDQPGGSGSGTVARESSDPYEDPHVGYWFLGAFYRHIIVPTFLQSLFVDGGATASNPAFGLEATYRKDNFDITMAVWWASFAFEGPYRASGDPDEDTEIIDGNPSVIFASASFMWSTPFNDMFALEYGLDVGLGVVLGHVTRNEAFRGGPDATFDGYGRCSGIGDTRGPGGYCEGPAVGDGERGAHYNVTARKWTEGGSVPNIVPWLAIPHLALRFKPVHQLMMRVDFGFGLGFFFGGAINYGF